MNKYTKPEIEINDFTQVDVIATSTADTPEKLITWGNMTNNFDSGDVNLFK